MARPYVTLAEHPTDTVRLACTKCERRRQYRKSTLIERYGPDKNMVDLQLELAAGLPEDRCRQDHGAVRDVLSRPGSMPRGAEHVQDGFGACAPAWTSVI
jgi:hypothetical protein